MSFRWAILTLFPAFLLIGGCGSSTTSTASRSTPTSTAAPAATGTTPATPTTTTSSAATGTASTQAGGSSGSAGGSTQGSRSAGSADGGGAGSIRVPATFVIGAGGRLSPPTVSSPAFLAVQLTLSSRDGKSHRVEIRAPSLTSLFVPANGRATIRLRGLRAGRYPLRVDGATRGALLIGGEPGP